jgi:hypothetical protein
MPGIDPYTLSVLSCPVAQPLGVQFSGILSTFLFTGSQ